jgi:hypothetical protein
LRKAGESIDIPRGDPGATGRSGFLNSPLSLPSDPLDCRVASLPAMTPERHGN